MLIVCENISEIGNENWLIYFGLRRPQNHIFLVKTKFDSQLQERASARRDPKKKKQDE